MIKAVYCIRMKSGQSREEFTRYWREEHAPRVAAAASKLAFVRYVQSHVIAPELNRLLVESRGLGPAYDGITEVWIESEEAMTKAMGTEDGLEAMRMLIEDEGRFIDFSRSSLFMTVEHDIF